MELIESGVQSAAGVEEGTKLKRRVEAGAEIKGDMQEPVIDGNGHRWVFFLGAGLKGRGGADTTDKNCGAELGDAGGFGRRRLGG